ncbi:MAG: DUF6797 domain-containing protein, partial [Pirellula sp.]
MELVRIRRAAWRDLNRSPRTSTRTWAALLVGCCWSWLGHSHASGQSIPSLEAELRSIATSQLATEARTRGDAVRGAMVFFHPSLLCAKCHVDASPTSTQRLGPDLARYPDPKPTDEHLIESVLFPSRTIRSGYETQIVKTSSDEIHTGIAMPSPDGELHLQLANGERVVLPRSEIAESKPSTESLMPAGQVNLLSDRQQFFDLVKYLIDVRDGGPQRAAELRPAESQWVLTIPEYESHLDHAGLIGDWDARSLERGQAIYRRVCANCHGTRDQLGSLPTALRFGEGKFKNGSDPLAMYRTLTHGFGFMPAQTWMVPSQKYDVIHYIRETFMKDNPNVPAVAIDAEYLAGLPRGDTRGPEPSRIEVWSAMDYGNALTHCYEIPGDRLNIASKGIAIRLDPGPGGIARGNHWMVFDTDTLRWAAAWSADPERPAERFIDWRDIQFNGEHGIHPRAVGNIVSANANGPGWADPANGSWNDDQRVLGRDRRRYGPLPKPWGQFHGSTTHGSKVVVSYSVGGTPILESPRQLTDPATGHPLLARILNVAPHAMPLELRVADLPESDSTPIVSLKAIAAGERPARNDRPTRSTLQRQSLSAGIHANTRQLDWKQDAQGLKLVLDPSETPVQLLVWTSSDRQIDGSAAIAALDPAELDLRPLTSGSPPRWPQVLETQLAPPTNTPEFTLESLTWPESNPWLAQLRFTGLDFFADGSMAVCTWDGDVWHVRESPEKRSLAWRRIASGLYQPLGLKILRDTVYLTCRDQIAVLRDLNGDGEAESIECFNNDHQVTEHFHEFAMGLQADADGYLYYAKSGRHALPAVVPQHGTLLRVAPDGSSTEILATGFRAANGVCLNPDGSFLVTDQEGFWNPKNRINWVTYDPAAKPRFYGNMFGYHDVTDPSDDAMEPPLCWITNAFDRSPAELLWIDSPAWAELQGSLLNLSYGYGKLYLVLH